MNHRFYLVIPFLFISFFTYSQVLNYDILLKNDTIGSLVAERVSSENESHFTIKTIARVSFLLTFSLDNLFQASYRGQKMYYSFTRNIINEKEKERTETVWEQGGYVISMEGEKTKHLQREIRFSVACLYHEMPGNMEEIYSERFGCFLPIKKVSSSVVQLQLPDNKLNHYHYSPDGICQKVEVEQTLANLIIILRK